MNEGKIAVRYAKAMHLLAKEENILGTIESKFKNLTTSLSEIEELKDFLISPILVPSLKKKILFEILENHISTTTKRFLGMLIENKREAYLPSIIRVFLHMVREEEGIKKGVLTTPAEIDIELQQQIVKRISRVFDAKIELESNIDEKLIGGFILRLEDKQIDTSVRTQLKKVKREFLNT